MKELENHKLNKHNILDDLNIYTIIVVVVLVLVIGYGGYMVNSLINEISDTNNNLSETQENLFKLKKASEKEIDDLEKELARVENNRNMLAQSLESEQKKNEQFEDQISQISNTVGDLEKLSKIDPEILKKYSKTFFLNEHYVPQSLSMIEPKYLYYEDDPEQIHSNVKKFLTNMLDEAKKDGVELYVRSAYRSYGIQSNLKSNYIVTYGENTANKFSAEQGYSEHQLGTTVDVITIGTGGLLDGFGETEAFEWMQNNAYKYGFIMSYPEGNNYYYYEPWHWRFVGRELANYLHRYDKNFYDLEQRKIDEYLANVFD